MTADTVTTPVPRHRTDESADTTARGRPALNRLRRSVAPLAQSIDWPLALPTVGLIYGLWRGWLQPALHDSIPVSALTIVWPYTDWRPVSWAVPLIAAIALLIVAQTPAARSRLGRYEPAAAQLAAVLALATSIGFLVQSCFVDQYLQQRLTRDTVDLSNLQRIAGFTVPSPRLTTLGPIPLPAGASEVGSGLRSGFYVATVAALVLVSVTARRRHRSGTTRVDRRPVAALVLAMIVLLGAELVQAGLAHRAFERGQTASAAGQDAVAVQQFRLAMRRGDGLKVQPDVAAAYGVALLRTGAVTSPQLQLASSRLLLAAGRDLAALQIVADASRRWPTDAALQDEFVTQAIRYLLLRGAPQSVHRTIPSTADSAILRLALARYEIVNGDNPSAITDAQAACALAYNTEVRSIGLTFLSIAQTRSGNPTQGRATLLSAVQADKDYVNVMARSLLTGLYTTLPI